MIDIRFGPQICGDADAAAAREWLVTDGLGGYAMGTVGGLRTRRYHGLLVVAGETPAARHLGLVSLDPAVTLPGGRPGAPRRARVGARRDRPARLRTAGTLRPGRRAAPLALADRRRGDRAGDRHGARPLRGRRGAPAARRRPGAAGARGGLHLARRARRAAAAAGPRRRCGRRPTGWWSRRRSASPVRAGSRPGSGGWARTTGRRRPAAWPRARTSGTPARFAAALERPGDVARGAGVGGDPGAGAPAGRRRWWGQPGRRHRAVVAAARPADEVQATPGARRRRVRRRHSARPGRGGRLPLVRRLVAGHDDRLRGAVPRHRPRRRGPRAAARLRGDALGGDAGQHRRHRAGGVQHRRRDAVVPARGRPARRR